MEQNKNPTASPKAGKPETPLTEEQRQKRRKMLVYPLMGLLFLGSMWLIFAPSEKEKAEAAQGTGFNTEMPLPAESGIIADKRTAYEQARMEEKQKERRAQMHDLADLFADKEQDKETAAEDFDLLNPEAGVQPAPSYGGGGSRPKQTIRSSAAAYEDINRTLGNFYETPADDPEKEELRERIEELEAMMARQSAPEGSTLDDQVALLEKSYELAAKYMPAGQGGASQAAATGKPEQKPSRNGKAVAVPVNQVAVNVVSALAQPMDDAEFMRTHAAERNYGFNTAVGNTGAAEEHHCRVRTRQPDRNRRAKRPPAAAGSDGRGRGAYPAQHPRRGCGTGAGRAARRGDHLAGISRVDYSGRTLRVRQRRAGRHLHPELVGGPRGQGDRRQHGFVARFEHQHLHRRGGAARLRSRKGRHTGDEPVHRPEDAHRKGAFEGRI